MLIKISTYDIDYHEVISERRSEKQRWIYHTSSSWITWSIKLWLLWKIVLWKETLCKTWIVFILIKCICFIIKTNHVWSRVKTLLLKNYCFPNKTIVFQHVLFFIPLFWNENLSLGESKCIFFSFSSSKKCWESVRFAIA